MKNTLVTVFTPAYNRAKTLPRVFECLKSQTYRNFEWIIIDDGSSDNTKEVCEAFLSEKTDFEITYRYQTNKGKHVATNVAAALAKGDFFITLDSDDSCKPEAIETFIKQWNRLDESQKKKYKGISCRTCDKNGKLNGERLSSEYIDCSDLDLRFKYKVKGELWGMVRTDIVKANPYPEIEGLHFYPENIYWDEIGRKYTTRFVDIPLRYYINDQNNALTDKCNSSSKETFFMRVHFVNDCWDYFKYDRKFFIKSIVGLSRDGLFSGKKYKEITGIPNSFFKKFLTVSLFPLGWLLYVTKH